MAGRSGSSCPSCGARDARRYDPDLGRHWCVSCGREFDPYELGADEADPLTEAFDEHVSCPDCGRRFTLRSLAPASNERIAAACGRHA